MFYQTHSYALDHLFWKGHYSQLKNDVTRLKLEIDYFKTKKEFLAASNACLRHSLKELDEDLAEYSKGQQLELDAIIRALSELLNETEFD